MLYPMYRVLGENNCVCLLLYRGIFVVQDFVYCECCLHHCLIYYDHTVLKHILLVLLERWILYLNRLFYFDFFCNMIYG